jgi:mono/diheme cytochrome c family protein
MDYPIWFLPSIGGGTLIALIAVTHITISHFAVGGGLYLVLAERKGLREGNGAILEFTRLHARFFLLVTMIAGSLTGVGIWFIISLVQPAATSLLIHTFLFAWATEWVFFLVEIVAIFVYYYTFGRMDPRSHQRVGWLYCAAAALSLFVVNGIVDFMLAPGAWPRTRDFWAGFFNPVFWPSLVFRGSMASMFAGVYAFVTTAFAGDAQLKRTMSRFSGTWVLVSLLVAAPAGAWYLTALPGQARLLVDGASPTIHRALHLGIAALFVVIAGTLVMILVRPAFHARPVALAVFAGAFLLMGAFEWTREASRRPFVINEIMYSTGVLQDDLPALKERGLLAAARWARIKEVREENLVEAGSEIFKLQCYACHTIRGFNNDIAARTRDMDYQVLAAFIGDIHATSYFMPPFAGTAREAGALAAFIVKSVHGKELPPAPPVAAAPDEAGALFKQRCTLCHPMELVQGRTAGWDRARVSRALERPSALNPAMPDSAGTPKEREMLADFIMSLKGLRGPAQGGAP